MDSNLFSINGVKFTVRELSLRAWNQVSEIIDEVNRDEEMKASVGRIEDIIDENVRMSEMMKRTNAYNFAMVRANAVGRIAVLVLRDEAGAERDVDFFLDAKQSEVNEAVNFFFQHEGSSLVNGVISLMILPLMKNLQGNGTKL